MKTLFFCIMALVLQVGIGFAQNGMAITDKRLVAKGILNDSSFSIKATEFQVEMNPISGEISILFDANKAKLLEDNSLGYAKTNGLHYAFKGSIAGLESKLKNRTVPVQKINDTWELTVNNFTAYSEPVTISIETLNGTVKPTKLLKFTGSFNPEDFGLNKQHYQWGESIEYGLVLTVIIYD